MRLSIFQSLAKAPGRLSEASFIAASQRIQKCANDSYFHGVELRSSEVTKDVLGQCSNLNVQVLAKLAPKSTDDVFRQLDDLSSELAKVKGQDVGKVMRLIVVQQPPITSAINNNNNHNYSTIDYLSDVLPVAAQFMETHPTIGKSKGERNAHGNPIDNHVLGVCHQLALLPKTSPWTNDFNNMGPSSNDHTILQQFLGILDVLPPTRLSLDVTDAESLETCVKNSNEGDITWDVEPLIQSIDHFDFKRWKPSDTFHQKECLHQQVWKWQKEVQVTETYVSCDDEDAARSLHDYFQHSV